MDIIKDNMLSLFDEINKEAEVKEREIENRDEEICSSCGRIKSYTNMETGKSECSCCD